MVQVGRGVAVTTNTSSASALGRPLPQAVSHIAARPTSTTIKVDLMFVRFILTSPYLDCY
jgi:hypothetical protein